MEIIDTDHLDQSAMQRLAAGHDAALNELMARNSTPIFRFLYRMLGNEEDANDLAQETFVRVFQNRNSFRHGAKFSTWLYTIAGNLARNHHRWRARHPNVSLDAQNDNTEQSLNDALPGTSATPHEAAEAAERAAAVRAAVAGLPEELREALILCEWEELSVAEAAAILRTTSKGIESRLYRARKILRERLFRLSG